MGRPMLSTAAAAPATLVPGLEIAAGSSGNASSPRAGSAPVTCSRQGCSAPAALLLGSAPGLSHSPLLPSPSTLQAVPLFLYPPPSKSADLKGVIKYLHLGKGKLRQGRTGPEQTSCRETQHPHAITRHPPPHPFLHHLLLQRHPKGWPGLGRGGGKPLSQPGSGPSVLPGMDAAPQERLPGRVSFPSRQLLS